jgi:hypothetical protein
MPQKVDAARTSDRGWRARTSVVGSELSARTRLLAGTKAPRSTIKRPTQRFQTFNARRTSTFAAPGYASEGRKSGGQSERALYGTLRSAVLLRRPDPSRRACWVRRTGSLRARAVIAQKGLCYLRRGRRLGEVVNPLRSVGRIKSGPGP